MKKSTALLICSLLLLSSQSVLADAPPVLTPACTKSIQISEVRGGNGVFLDETCKIAYVLPPVRGEVTLDSILASAELSQCSSLESAMTQLNQLTQLVTNPLAVPNPQQEEEPSRPRRGRQPRNQETPSKVIASSPSAEDEEARIKTLSSRRAHLDQILERYGRTLGLTGQLTFSVDMANLVDAYRSANEGSGVEFRAMPLKGAKVVFKPADSSSAYDIPLVLSSSIGGVSVAAKEAASGAASVDFGSSVGGQVDLSLAAACPLRNRFTNSLPKRLTARQMSAALVPTMYYTYEVQGSYKYKATYNRGALAKKIKESSSSGGFFKTSSVARISESSASQSWFKFQSDCTDSRVCQKYDSAIIEKIRNRMIDEVLKGIEISKLGKPEKMPTAAAPSVGGSKTAADGLRENCDSDYCQYGAFVLDVLSSTFGGQSKTESYIKNNDHWAEESVEDRQMLEFKNSLAFGPRN